MFLISHDYDSLSDLRRVLHFERMTVEGRRTLLVEVDKPLIGQNYGWGCEDITKMYLINRHDELAFERLNDFPIYVHVLVAKSPTALKPSKIDNLLHFAWASLHISLEDV